MKTLKSLGNSPLRHRDAMVNVVALAETVRATVRAAQAAVEGATQKCLAAGQALIDAKAAIERPRDGGRFIDQGNDGFLEWIRKNVPEVSVVTAQRWMRAARNVSNALPERTIDVETVSVSELLSMPDAELTEAAREYKQAWFDFTSDKTIKECLGLVCVEGEDGHRVDRAINGKLKGGSKGENRKDYPLFVLRKVKETSAHLAHWDTMDAGQRNECLTVFTAAILGDFVSLPGRAAGKMKFEGAWPEDVCEALVTVLKKRLKG